jgi:hypothetical protein
VPNILAVLVALQAIEACNFTLCHILTPNDLGYSDVICCCVRDVIMVDSYYGERVVILPYLEGGSLQLSLAYFTIKLDLSR